MPAVFHTPAPVEEYISPAPPGQCFHPGQRSSAFGGGDHGTLHGLGPGQGSTVRGGAVGSGRSLQDWRVQFADSSWR